MTMTMNNEKNSWSATAECHMTVEDFNKVFEQGYESRPITKTCDLLDLLEFKQTFDVNEDTALYIGKTMPSSLADKIIESYYDPGFDLYISVLKA